MLKLLFTLLFMPTFLAVAATARAEAFAVAPPWEAEVIFDQGGRFQSCAVSRPYNGGGVLSLIMGNDRSLFMLVGGGYLIPPADWRGFLTLSVDDGLAYRVPAEAVDDSIAIELTDAAALRVLLENGKTLRFNDIGAADYPLAGARQSLPALAACVDRHLAAIPAAVETPAAAVLPRQGTMVELDTYVGEAMAREDWADMKKALGVLLDGREPIFTTRTRSRDGRAFIVMRIAGFAGPDEAAGFCAAMKKMKRDCTVR